MASKDVLQKISSFITEKQIDVLELNPTDFITRFNSYYYETNKNDIISEKIEKINNEGFGGLGVLNTNNYSIIRKHIMSEIQTMKSRTGLGIQDALGFIFRINGFLPSIWRKS